MYRVGSVKKYLKQINLGRKKAENVKSEKCKWENICTIMLFKFYIKKKEKRRKKRLVKFQKHSLEVFYERRCS